MAKSQGAGVLSELVQISGRLEAWRRTRAAGVAIPEDVWQEAAQLARIYGVGAVARPLRLHHGKLSELVRSIRPDNNSRPTFVEVSTVSPPPASRECVVEMKRRDGAWMMIRVPNEEMLLSLCESFWRGRA
jgi:hypothetical protein